LTSFIPLCIPFISSSSPIALARHSKTMLDKRWEKGQPCHVPDFRGNGFSVYPLKR
jgi:hypothetical protein